MTRQRRGSAEEQQDVPEDDLNLGYHEECDPDTEEPQPEPVLVRIENVREGDVVLSFGGKEIVIPGGRFDTNLNKFVNGFVEVDAALLKTALLAPAVKIYFTLGYLVKV